MDAGPSVLWEQLLLAQAVYQVAASPPEWEKVASLLSTHPLVQEKKTQWNAGQCEQAWKSLMLGYAITEEGDAQAPKSGRNAQLALAQKLYAARLGEIHEQIKEKETKFRDLHQRLQDLESGKLDERLREEAGIPDETPRRKRRAEAAEVSADDDDEADEHLQVEQDLLGDDGPAEAHVPETPEREERTPQPATTYKSRARRRTESRGRSLTADESLSRTPSPGRTTRRSRRATPEADEHSASEDGHGTDGVSDAERDKSRRRTTQVLLMLHNEVSNHTHGNLFHQAIKEADAPDYYSLIKQPMDLKLIKQRIKEGTIASALDLRRALSLMFANALMYNRPDTEVHRMANEMRLATDETP